MGKVSTQHVLNCKGLVKQLELAVTHTAQTHNKRCGYILIFLHLTIGFPVTSCVHSLACIFLQAVSKAVYLFRGKQAEKQANKNILIQPADHIFIHKLSTVS